MSVEPQPRHSGTQLVVCPAGEISPGERRFVEHKGRQIALFNWAGKLYAVRNYCPHQGAPVCMGRVGGTMQPSPPHEWIYSEESPVLTCPWHHYEFELATGSCLTDPRLRVRTYEVEIDDDMVVVQVTRHRGANALDQGGSP